MPKRRCTGYLEWPHFRENKNKTNFKTSQVKSVKALVGEDAYEEQTEYLWETKKPQDMDVHRWIRRMKAISSYLPTLNSGATALTEDQLVRLITKSMPKQWKV